MKPFTFILLIGLSGLILQGCGGGGGSNDNNTPPTTSSNLLSDTANTSTSSEAQVLNNPTQLSSDITSLFGNNTAEPVDVADNEDLSAVINRLEGQP